MNPDRIPLEDNYLDILAKAQRGLGIADDVLLRSSDIAAAEFGAVRAGLATAGTLTKLAPVLGLSARALVESSKSAWYPRDVEVDGLRRFNSAYGDMTVNAYVCWDQAAREAVAFDTGGDASALISFLEANQLRLRLLLLTHTHPDHVADFNRLVAATGAPAWVNEREPLPGARSFAAGRSFAVGRLEISTVLTSGHSAGGITYLAKGLARSVAVVGDSIFAGSMGGSLSAYREALANNREKILSLPGDTVLCPGHGPLTTVAEEAAHNPFFAP